jgi:hypothetical protein
MARANTRVQEASGAMKALRIGLLALLGFLVVPLPGVAPGIARGQKPPPKIELPRPGFELIAQERGVSVYQNDSSNMIWIGAVGIIPAPADKIHKALLDYEHQIGKIGRVSEVKVLSREPDSLYVYQRLSLPVISDRDVTLRVVHGVDGKRRWIAYWAVTDRGPKPREGIVRVTRDRGVWELVAIPGGKSTLARYEMRMDLGGDVPLWMAKGNAGDEIPELYSSVCKLSLGESEAGTCP